MTPTVIPSGPNSRVTNRKVVVHKPVGVRLAAAEAGYLTQQFIDGQDFLDGLNPYVAAVVLGIMMPRLTGIDVLRWLRRHRPGLPVVTMSGGIYRDSGDELLALGAKAHLPKPFQPEELVGAVSSLFE